MSGEGGRRIRGSHGKLWAIRLTPIIATLLLTSAGWAGGRAFVELSQSPADSIPIAYARHTAGRLGLTVSNFGIFGYRPAPFPAWDYVTGDVILNGSEFPIGSRRDYFGSVAIWVGGIRGTDTLVSAPFDSPPPTNCDRLL